MFIVGQNVRRNTTCQLTTPITLPKPQPQYNFNPFSHFQLTSDVRRPPAANANTAATAASTSSPLGSEDADRGEQNPKNFEHKKRRIHRTTGTAKDQKAPKTRPKTRTTRTSKRDKMQTCGSKRGSNTGWIDSLKCEKLKAKTERRSDVFFFSDVGSLAAGCAFFFFCGFKGAA